MRISDWSSDVCSSDLRGWLRIDVYQGRGKWPANIACLGHDSIAPRRPVSQPNKSFKPNLLRYTSNMAGKACHVAGSATQVGLTQALGLTKTRFGAGGCASERSPLVMSPGFGSLRASRVPGKAGFAVIGSPCGFRIVR